MPQHLRRILSRSLGAMSVVVACALSVMAANGQSTTGTITGRVTDAQGLAAPGVRVTATSPNLQGARTAITSGTGDYIVTLLPAGPFVLTFELQNFAVVELPARLAPTQTLTVDATLSPAPAMARIEVTGQSANILTRSAQAATIVPQTLVAALPTNRDLNASVLLAAGVHATGPLGAYSIGGGMTFANLFLVNGVPTGDNLRGQPYDLYIEDAVQETVIASAGVSAEFGRFGGGVVNIVTKSGGNRFSGSLRDTLVNEAWRNLTPFEEAQRAADATSPDPRVDRTVPTYEYTIGGPISTDRLWFFAAGRNQTQESGRTLVETGIPYTYTSRQRRYEAKATAAVTSTHRLEGSFLSSYEKQTNQSQNPAAVMDVTSLYNPERPMNLFTVEYNGILSPRLFVQARVSARNETLKGVGGENDDRVFGTLLIDRMNRRYWAPTFCASCGAEERDGQDVFMKGTYFLTSRRGGSHTMTFGYDRYNDRRYANNHQSGSDYRLTGTTALRNGTELTAQFISGTTQILWQPVLVTSKGTSFQTHSAFYSDSWRLATRVTANLGLRYDRNHAVDSSGGLVATSDSWSPRLGLIIDPRGDQKWAFIAGVARYVEALASTIANGASAAGNPDLYQYAYLGPDINTDPTQPLIPTDEGIRQVFKWFDDNGGAARSLVRASVVGVTPTVGALRSPDVWEYSGGISGQLGARVAVRADLTYRDFGSFYAIRTDTSTGTVIDTRPDAPAGVAGRAYDRGVIENTDLLSRQYAGLALQAQYRQGAFLDAGATYTLSRAWGNIDGETANGPAPSGVLQYPEYQQESWSYPTGDLSLDQRHRARLWANLTLPKVPGLSVSVLQTLESGTPYGAVSQSGVEPQGLVPDPGYRTPPSGSTTQYYFTSRDAFRTEGQRRTDIAVGYVYRMKLRGAPQLFGQLQVLNVLDHFQLCGCGAATALQDGGGVNTSRIDQTVRTPVTFGYPAFNPFTTIPVEGVNWAKGPNFGGALTRFAYTTPRTLRFTFGVRF